MMNFINMCCTQCDMNHVAVDLGDSLVKLHAQTTSDRYKFYLYVLLETEVREIEGDVGALPSGAVRRMSFYLQIVLLAAGCS